MRKFVGFEVSATEEVSACWRCLPLACYLLVAVASIGCAVAMGTVVLHLKDQCPLYAKPAVTAYDGFNITLNEQSSSEERTHWGDMHVCYLAQFLPIFTVIFSAAWFFFFCMCGKGGRGSAEGFGMDSPWRIVFPGLFFNFGMTMASLVSGIWISGGIGVFCHSLEASEFNISCHDLDHLYFTDYPDLTLLSVWFTVAQVSSWLAFCGLMAVTLLLLLRCVVRPDLTPLYEAVRPPSAVASAAGDMPHRTSSDSFVTADTTPLHGPGGDVLVTPEVHAEAS